LAVVVADVPPEPAAPPVPPWDPPVVEGSPPPLDEQPTIPMDAKSAPAAQIDNKYLVFIFGVSPLFVDLLRTLKFRGKSVEPRMTRGSVSHFA